MLTLVLIIADSEHAASAFFSTDAKIGNKYHLNSILLHVALL